MSDVRRHVPAASRWWDAEAAEATVRSVDGTLLFADISGFTALTERLSRRGRIGAEEIVETLNRVFGGMLVTAERRGGDLLKFGGDALLFLFRGEGHARRACDCAVEMRTALREAAAQPTEVGRLRLAMSVGIHSGDILLVLAGGPTRELLVLGPGADRTIDAEHAAGPGEIVVTPSTAALLPRGSTRDRGDGRLLLRRRRAVEPVVPGHEARAGVDRIGRETAQGLFPTSLGRYLDPGPPEPEHRLATIAFVRFSGVDDVLATGGPNAVGLAVHDVLRSAMACLAAEGVTLLAVDLDRDGGKLFLASGVPQASEDDEGRMLRALRRLFDQRTPLRLQAGLNRGHVFAAEVGTGERAAFSAMGDTTNTAARIAAKAPPGAVYADPSVLEHSRTRFGTTPAGPFRLKGKARPLLVYEVGGDLGARERRESGRLPLLGRDGEAAAIRSAVSAALGVAGDVVTITGETGMGKSRLAREVLESAGGVARVVVRGEPYGAASPYRIFRDPLRRLLGVDRGDPHEMGGDLVRSLHGVAPDLVPLAPLLADVAQVDVPPTPEVDAIDPQFRPDRTADALVRLVETTLPGPLVLLVDDAHWADMASTHLLERLVVASTGRPWAMVVTRRAVPGGFQPGTGTLLPLEPLPREVTERLVLEAAEGAAMRPHEMQRWSIAPRETRSSSRNSTGSSGPRAASTHCPTPSMQPPAHRSTCSSRIHGESCGTPRSSVAASAAPCCTRRSPG